ncbi:MAG: hypothetical protein KKC11_02385, partial [Candidatus Omnitrophica bacterium]|nr:hypothetical protein [Candidatus Omnitrophota bacterium]
NLDMLLVNRGTIKVKDGGFGVLIAGGIENEGKIIANAGKVVLAGGDAVKLNISNNGLISVIIDEAVASEVLDHQGKAITDQIKNTGTIEANGGTVIFNAESLPGIFAKAVNLEGFIKANKLRNIDGIVKIVADKDVRLAAKIKASNVEVGNEEKVPENVEIAGGSVAAENNIKVLAKNDINVNVDVTAKKGDIRLFADYDGDLKGSFRQLAGVIEAKGKGNVYIDSSETAELGKIITEAGSIKIGEQRAPQKIEGSPHYIHGQGDFQITKKTQSNNSAVINTERGDVLRYNPEGSLALEAVAGRIIDSVIRAPLDVDYLSLYTRSLLINPLSISSIKLTDVYINIDTQGGYSPPEAEAAKITYLASSKVGLKSNSSTGTKEAVVITAAGLYLTSNRFGKNSETLSGEMNQLPLNRIINNVEIMKAAGIGTSMLARGPPEVVNLIVYAKKSHLISAEVAIPQEGSSLYFHTNLALYSLNSTLSSKETYSLATKIETPSAYTLTEDVYLNGTPGNKELTENVNILSYLTSDARLNTSKQTKLHTTRGNSLNGGIEPASARGNSVNSYVSLPIGTLNPKDEMLQFASKESGTVNNMVMYGLKNEYIL